MANQLLFVILLTSILAAFTNVSGVLFNPKTGRAIVPMHSALSNEMINYINLVANTTWKADRTDRFKSVSQVKRLLGVLRDESPVTLPEKSVEILQDIPATFDSRVQWPSCKSIQQIRDQSNCGSCWAFAAVEAMSDRICVKTQGTLQVYISAEDLLSCCGFTCGMGCDGGYPYSAWQFYKNKGIVTGGLYQSNQGCLDYSLPPCAHHVNSTVYPPCEGDSPTPKCTRQCQPSYGQLYNNDKHFAQSVYTVPRNVEQIQTEIMTHGPVEASFTVYADFPSYSSGVYQHESGGELGGHAVKIIGWGEENGTPYWLVANSWNPSWGDGGYFKILRGKNECGIESGIVAGIPK